MGWGWRTTDDGRHRTAMGPTGGDGAGRRRWIRAVWPTDGGVVDGQRWGRRRRQAAAAAADGGRPTVDGGDGGSQAVGLTADDGRQWGRRRRTAVAPTPRALTWWRCAVRVARCGVRGAHKKITSDRSFWWTRSLRQWGKFGGQNSGDRCLDVTEPRSLGGEVAGTLEPDLNVGTCRKVSSEFDINFLILQYSTVQYCITVDCK